jgi:hypothetical protein
MVDMDRGLDKARTAGEGLGQRAKGYAQVMVTGMMIS